MVHTQGVRVCWAVTGMTVLKESVLQGNMVTADVWEEQGAIHCFHRRRRIPGKYKRYLSYEI